MVLTMLTSSSMFLMRTVSFVRKLRQMLPQKHLTSMVGLTMQPMVMDSRRSPQVRPSRRAHSTCWQVSPLMVQMHA